MQVNDKNNFFAVKFCFQNKWWKWTSESEFYYPELLQSPFNSESTERKSTEHSSQMKKFTTFSEANNKQTGGQENNFSGWTVR